MSDQIRGYLDGELGFSELPEHAREEARAWEELFQEARAVGSDGAPEGLEETVMQAVLSEAAAEGLGDAPAPEGAPRVASSEAGESFSEKLRGFVGWLVRPRPVPVPPAAALVAAAALLLWLWPGVEAPPTPPTGPSSVYVEFVMEAPGASSVSVAGDFTDWQPEVQLQDADGDGVWSGRVRLGPGIHEYMFVIDGSRWVTDPHAERYVDDGFGSRNAVLAIATPANGT